MGNADKAGFNGVVAAAFPEHPRQLVDIAIGIRVTGSSAQKQKNGMLAFNTVGIMLRLIQEGEAIAPQLQNFRRNPKMATVMEAHLRMTLASAV